MKSSRKKPLKKITIEGEHAIESSFIVDLHDPLFTKQTPGGLQQRTFPLLSGGRASLLCTRQAPGPDGYYARYELKLDKPFAGAVWVREQGRLWASPFSWRIDDGGWHDTGTNLVMHRGDNLAKDGPSFTWCRIGEADIPAGTHAFTVKVTQPKENGCYLLSQDCFVFVPAAASASDGTEAYPWKPARRKDDPELPTGRSIYVWGASPPAGSVETGFRPWIEPYPVKTRKPRGAVLVSPGGAYRGRAPYEGSDIARAFNKKGFHAFVLQYRVFPHTREEALADAQRAMRLLRKRAREWNVDPNKIAACGFSAGAHLSGSLGMLQLPADKSSKDPVERYHSRPDALILCYPPAYNAFDVREKGVPENFPPAFIWHTVADEMVSVDNSLAIAAAMRARKIPFEMHLFPDGRHGLALRNENPHVQNWFALCCEWLEGLGWKG